MSFTFVIITCIASYVDLTVVNRQDLNQYFSLFLWELRFWDFMISSWWESNLLIIIRWRISHQMCNIRHPVNSCPFSSPPPPWLSLSYSLSFDCSSIVILDACSSRLLISSIPHHEPQLQINSTSFRHCSNLRSHFGCSSMDIICLCWLN